jgi:hypothetical protein
VFSTGMRRLTILSTSALMLAGCVAREPAPPPVTTPTPVAAKPQVVHSDLMGATAGQLIQLLGQPALQVREGPGLKLQFRGRTCVLDTYLYPTANGERVTYVDARLPSGTDTNTQQCIAAQLGR